MYKKVIKLSITAMITLLILRNEPLCANKTDTPQEPSELTVISKRLYDINYETNQKIWEYKVRKSTFLILMQGNKPENTSIDTLDKLREAVNTNWHYFYKFCEPALKELDNLKKKLETIVSDKEVYLSDTIVEKINTLQKKINKICAQIEQLDLEWANFFVELANAKTSKTSTIKTPENDIKLIIMKES